MTKNTDIDKYKYSGYGIGFDSKGSFTHPGEEYSENVIIFGADLSSSVHANNKTRSILALDKDILQGIDHFTEQNKKFCLSLYYNGDSSYLFVNGKEIINFKAKDSEIVPYLLCLGNISKDFDASNAAKTGLDGYVYDFSVYYWAVANDKILDIHKYLMKRTIQYKYLDLLKKCFLQQ